MFVSPEFPPDYHRTRLTPPPPPIDYYSRYRPGLGAVLAGLTVFSCFIHYVVLYLTFRVSKMRIGQCVPGAGLSVLQTCLPDASVAPIPGSATRRSRPRGVPRRSPPPAASA